MSVAHDALATIWSAAGGDRSATARVEFHGDAELPSAFSVTDLASASIGAAALAASELARNVNETPDSAPIRVDRRLASAWFLTTIDPIGWQLPPVWDAVAGDYESSDGWIRLHTNAPHHRAAALRVLGCAPDREAVARAVAKWDATELESAVVDAGGCAAEMRTIAAWEEHPHGREVASEPLIHTERFDERDPDGEAGTIERNPTRPLRGVRVLDLTRVLAGPVATRFLAGLGAEVLRIDPPGWDEPAIVPEVTLGKRCARLDATTSDGRRRIAELLYGADVIVHGYRPDALAGLAFDSDARRELRPGLVDVSLDAYGWTGPWRMRRGFDSLVQMSCGIAAAGMEAKRAGQPFPLPVQALDHATGYLMATAALRGLQTRRTDSTGTTARVSLARTARLLAALERRAFDGTSATVGADDYEPGVEHTPWGDLRRLRPPVTVPGVAISWTRGATTLGSDEPAWM
ncbi:MAG TPA: CoA transferase [Acidimicrobiia bacterium]|nr:CoA transferase [Acidimicrobiia bacterium]